MVILSKRLRLRSLMFCLAILSISTPGAPILGASGSSVTKCERLLGEAKRITERYVRSEQEGLWERLRSLREACNAPEVNAKFRAKAALIYRILPEYSEMLPRAAMLESIEEELETLSAPTAELLEIVELKAGSLEVGGKVGEAAEAVEKSLRLREALYGEDSTEFALGLLGSARFQAMSASDRERALSLADEGIAIAFRSPIATEEDRRKVLALAEDLFKELGLTAAEIRDRVSAVTGAS